MQNHIPQRSSRTFTLILWLAALLITLASAYFQRLTGPTYPVAGTAELASETVAYRFDRSHSGQTDAQVLLHIDNTAISGKLYWKRYKVSEDWHITDLERSDLGLYGYLPNQPKAGKLEYYIRLTSDGDQVRLPEENVVIRFKGVVPAYFLIPHIIIIFLAMVFSNRAGLEAFRKVPSFKPLVWLTLIFLIGGGLILGPIVQLFAFDALWTGFPLGKDLTDTKTLIAVIFWIIPLVQIYRDKAVRGWVFVAAIVTLAVYLIPHSLLGSELDYSKLPVSATTP